MSPLSWFAIVRLGLVQAALGAVVVLTTVTLNRVMVVELSLPAILPGALVALHYGVQVLRPRLGFGSDVGQRRTPWIIGGMAALAVGGASAAAATALMATDRLAGVALAIPAFTLVGLGVGAAGTSLLVLMAKQVAPARRPAAATILWLLMIMGIAVTATLVGKLLHPFSLGALVRVACEVAAGAFLLATAAVWGIEQAGTPAAARGAAKPDTPGASASVLSAAAPGCGSVVWPASAQAGTADTVASQPVPAQLAHSAASYRPVSAEPCLPELTASGAAADKPSFAGAMREVWAEPQARRFAIFVFVSMLAYSAQELILEPFAGAVMRLTPGQTAGLTGLQHGGVMAGMLLVALGGSLAGAGRRAPPGRTQAMRAWTMGGCLASAVALAGLACAGLAGPAWPLQANVFALGMANGTFAVSAIGAMMGLASQGRGSREGVRMGLWGAAQALAFGAGGLLGTGASDAARAAFGAPAPAYAAVFACEATLFLAAAWLAAGVFQRTTPTTTAVPGHAGLGTAAA